MWQRVNHLFMWSLNRMSSCQCQALCNLVSSNHVHHHCISCLFAPRQLHMVLTLFVLYYIVFISSMAEWGCLQEPFMARKFYIVVKCGALMKKEMEFCEGKRSVVRAIYGEYLNDMKSAKGLLLMLTFNETAEQLAMANSVY